jgi:hypothetical protein
VEKRRKLSPAGNRTPAVQPLASRYTDSGIMTPLGLWGASKNLFRGKLAMAGYALYSYTELVQFREQTGPRSLLYTLTASRDGVTFTPASSSGQPGSDLGPNTRYRNSDIS